MSFLGHSGCLSNGLKLNRAGSLLEPMGKKQTLPHYSCQSRCMKYSPEEITVWNSECYLVWIRVFADLTKGRNSKWDQPDERTLSPMTSVLIKDGKRDDQTQRERKVVWPQTQGSELGSHQPRNARDCWQSPKSMRSGMGQTIPQNLQKEQTLLIPGFQIWPQSSRRENSFLLF